MIESFLSSLRELPDVCADLDMDRAASSADHGYDAHVNLHVAGKSITLLIETKKAVYPRDVRQVLWQFRDLSLK